MQELSNLGKSFLDALQSGPVSHPHFRGPKLDTGGLSARDLGLLLPIAWRIMGEPDDTRQPAFFVAKDIDRCAQETHPLFEPEGLLDGIEGLALRHERSCRLCKNSVYSVEPLQSAVDAIQGCIGKLPERIADLIPRLLIPDNGHRGWALYAALAMHCRAAVTERVMAELRTALAEAPLMADELEAMRAMPTDQALILAQHISGWCNRHRKDADGESFGPNPLSDLAGYAAFCDRTLAKALRRLSQIHDGSLPYRSDKAFVLEEGSVIGRAVRVGLDRNGDQLLATLRMLWLRVGLAPGTSATMPSQSVSVTLGHAVAHRPSPGAISLMREVIASLRHQGNKKKLAQMLRTAERRLATRPDLILLLPPGEPIAKRRRCAARSSISITLHRRFRRKPGDCASSATSRSAL